MHTVVSDLIEMHRIPEIAGKTKISGRCDIGNGSTLITPGVK